ncbi:hypothetical protein [Actinomadura craniellae]|uniref:hypothetical protein n=1 Tax=Actinomadura craniellae TaxID=2231787 RepID=UPI0011BFE243|nr:hypothetical protein [Actinomadura craniellae]
MPPQRWEHVIDTYNPHQPDSWSSPDELLDAYSADGWELVSHSENGQTLTFVFKRPASAKRSSRRSG